METLPVVLFTLNLILILVDASVAYHKVPVIISARTEEPDGKAVAERNVCNLLPVLVAIYVALDCYSWRTGDFRYLGGLTFLLCFDILLQLRLARRDRSPGA